MNTGSIRGDFPSLKLGRMVRYSSSIERDLLYFLEYWQTVSWYREQPMCIKYRLPNGEIHRYTPDYEIHEGANKTLVECKPESRLDAEHSQRQREIGKAWSEENGYSFRCFTETELRAGHRLENIKLWWRYARLEKPSTKDLVLECMGKVEQSSANSLYQALNLPPQEITQVVCCLLFQQKLEMVEQEAFNVASYICLRGRQKHVTDTN
jgi:hypothetical protein